MKVPSDFGFNRQAAIARVAILAALLLPASLLLAQEDGCGIEDMALGG